jgi:hypothetical protein
MANIIQATQGIMGLFRPHFADCSTLDELYALSRDHARWPKAHDLLSRIRKKVLAAEQAGDGLLQMQYGFEEVCAKTFYNMSGSPAPFDAHVPFLIIPIAIDLTRRLKLSDSQIVNILMS